MLKSKRNVYLIGSALLLTLSGSAFAMENTTPVNGTPPSEIEANQSEVQLSIEKVNDSINKITLSLNQAPSAGYKVQIDGIQYGESNKAYLLYSLEQPKPGDMNAQVITYPKAVTYVPSNFEVTAVEGQSMLDILSEGPSIRGTIKEFTKEQPKTAPKTDNVVTIDPKTIDPNTPVSNNAQMVGSATATQTTKAETASIQTAGSFQVEGLKDSKMPYDKAKVTYNQETKFFKKQNGKLQPATVADLKVGTQLDSYFVGPVLYMYPVSATAGVIVIQEPAEHQQAAESGATVSLN